MMRSISLQSLQQMGNSRARAVYEANLPDSFRRPQTDCSLESFIRAKYEHKKYIAREWVPPPLPKVSVRVTFILFSFEIFISFSYIIHYIHEFVRATRRL